MRATASFKYEHIGVNFAVLAETGFDKYEVLEACRAELGAYFADHFEIGEDENCVVYLCT